MYLKAEIKEQQPSCLQCVCVCQMEVRVEDCLLRGDSSDLAYVLRHEGLSSITLTRLDQLVTKVTGTRPFCLLFVCLLCQELRGPDGLGRLLVVVVYCLLFVCLFVCLFVVSGAERTRWPRQTAGCVEVFRDSVRTQGRPADTCRTRTHC